MKKIILIYGAISGLIVIGVNTLSLDNGLGDVWLGFLVMFIALSSIYVGIKQYRDQHLGGQIQFSTALMVGLGISLVASIVYVAIWEIYSYATNYVFIEHYTNAQIELARSSGLSESELAKAISDAQILRLQYASPLFRLPMTFVEIFPVGVLISIISSALLRIKDHN